MLTFSATARVYVATKYHEIGKAAFSAGHKLRNSASPSEPYLYGLPIDTPMNTYLSIIKAFTHVVVVVGLFANYAQARVCVTGIVQDIQTCL